MSSTTLVPLEEYLKRSGKPACEYIDGVLRQRPMPNKLHAIEPVLLCVEILSPEDRCRRADSLGV